MIYYFDTSALVKNYVREVGSDWIRQIVQSARVTERQMAKVTDVEMVAVFGLKHRRGELSVADYTSCRRRFLQDSQRYFVRVNLSGAVLTLAVRLADTYPLRGYDAIQLATASIVAAYADRSDQPFTFLCADGTLCSAAMSEGMAIGNPNQHP